MRRAHHTDRPHHSRTDAYRMRTQLIHGAGDSSKRWDFTHHVMPPMVNQQKSAIRVARFLAQQPLVARVAYPGLETFPQYALARQQMVSYDGKLAPGSLLYFVLQGDATTARTAAERFLDAIAAHA